MGETCKLCLKYIQGDTVAVLDEDLLAKLDFIQMDLERSVEESNSICTDCKQKIQNAFNFKLSLVQTESAELGASGSQAQIPSSSSGESSTEKIICHLCKNSVDVSSVISLEKLLKDGNVMEVFQGHIPEIELEKSENSMVCEPCQKALASFYVLVSSWSIANDWNEDDDDMKEDMDNFGAVEVKKEDEDEFSDSHTNSSCVVDSSESGKITKKAKGNCGQIIKVKTESNEVSDSSESVYVDNKDVKKEDNEEEDEEANLQLKDEEVDIKDEDGLSKNEDEAISHLRESSIPISGPHEEVDQAETQLSRCTHCSFQTRWKHDLKKHEEAHKDKIPLFQCKYCSYKTNQKWFLNRHELNRHAFNRHELNRHALNRHELGHESLDKITLFRCSNCSFATKYKRNLKAHEITHTDVREMELLRCDCPYETIRKNGFLRHVKLHELPDDELFRCEHCPFKTKWKGSLGRHKIIHKISPSEASQICSSEPMFNCPSILSVESKTHNTSGYEGRPTSSWMEQFSKFLNEKVED